MLRSNSKQWGIRVVSPEEEKERLQWEGFVCGSIRFSISFKLVLIFFLLLFFCICCPTF